MNENRGLVILLVTTFSAEEAQRISQTLLERRKAACVNIIPQVNSSFWWQGKIDSAQENLLIIKTKESVMNEAVNLIKATHSYTVPEIIALPIIGGNPDYLEWLDKEVK